MSRPLAVETEDWITAVYQPTVWLCQACNRERHRMHVRAATLPRSYWIPATFCLGAVGRAGATYAVGLRS